MTHPLPRYKYGHLTVKLEFHHLKRCGMAVAHEVSDQTSILGYFAGPLTITDPGCLHNGIVSSHGIHEPDKPFI
jgi:hypothetical protein